MLITSEQIELESPGWSDFVANLKPGPFFIDFDESIMDQPTHRRTRPLIEMQTHLKTCINFLFLKPPF